MPAGVFGYDGHSLPPGLAFDRSAAVAVGCISVSSNANGPFFPTESESAAPVTSTITCSLAPV